MLEFLSSRCRQAVHLIAVWLPLVLISGNCNSSVEPANTGTSITVVTQTQGGVVDADGYTAQVEDPDAGGQNVVVVATAAVGNNASVSLTGVPSGLLYVSLKGVAPNCYAGPPGYDRQPVDIHPGIDTVITFQVDCTALPGGSTRILFETIESNQYTFNTLGIAILNPDGSVVGLSTNGVSETNPTWSPDGQKIAFSSNADSPANFAIYVMDTDGSHVVRLTNPTDGFGADEPSWSPDGTKIVFEGGHYGDTEIYVMNADGSNLTQLTNNSAGDSDPQFSPDGSKILFSSNRLDPATAVSVGKWEIYEMNADGTSVRQITADGAIAGHPVYFAAGTRILFDSDRLGSRSIYIMNTDGSGVTALTSGPDGTYLPVPSPDQSRIMFTGDANGYPDLYVMNADGTHVEPMLRKSQPRETNIGYSWR